MKPAICGGFVLTELLIAGLLTTFLMLGMIQMAAGAGRGLLLIESLSQTQQGGRFAIDQVRDTVMSAGFHPAPWEPGATGTALGPGTADGGANGNDTLEFHQYSDRNCYGNLNDQSGDNGRPAFYLRTSRFEVAGNNNLSHTCWFGPDGGHMVRQINRQGLVQQVESFQVLYAEDTNEDNLADHVVRANHWSDATKVVGIQMGVMLATGKPVSDESVAGMMVLDQVVVPHADGHRRQVWTTTIPFVSRLR